MDGFKDRFAEHLATPEEIISANSQAELTQTEALTEEVRQLVSSLDEKIGNIKVSGGQLDSEELAAALDGKLGEIEEKLENHIHKENVRVYRNVQAALGEELNRQSDQMNARLEEQSKLINEGMERQSKIISEGLDEQGNHIDEVMNSNNDRLIGELFTRMDMLVSMMNTINEQQKGVGATVSNMAVQLNDTQNSITKAVKSRALLAIQIVMLILVLGDLAINVLLTLGFL